MNIEEIYKKYKKIIETKGVSALPEPYRTVVAINTVQALLDNGGLEYLFENSFIDGFPVDVFIQSYKNIGCPKMAEIISNTYNKRLNRNTVEKYDNELLKLSEKVWKNFDKFIKIRGSK